MSKEVKLTEEELKSLRENFKSPCLKNLMITL